MKPVHWIALGSALVLTGYAAAAWASAPNDKSSRNTPPNWSYEVKDGKRVPRVPRTTNADGSWTEEWRRGNCTVTRTGRDGEVRESTKCD